MPGLRELQSGFVAALFDRQAADRLAPVVQARGIEPVRRLQVYRNNLFAGLTEVLAAVYPVTRRLVGAAYFDHAARGYIAAHPSRSGDVHAYGGRFGEYLGSCPGSDALPYLADTARLEWSYHEAFHGELLVPIGIDNLRAVPPEDYLQLRLSLQPSARLLVSDYPVLHIWQVNQDDWAGEPTVDLAEGGVRLLIQRQGVEVALLPLGTGELAWLQGLARGLTLLQAQQLATAQAPDFELGTALRRQLELGTFSGWQTERAALHGQNHPRIPTVHQETHHVHPI